MTESVSKPDSQSDPAMPRKLADAPIRKLIRPVVKFLEIESASGVLLVICTAVALAIANSPWSHAWESFWHTEAGFAFGSWELRKSLVHWVNDGLMTIFFFLVGLEIKRESIDGELRTLTKAALPIIAAMGGMLVPAGVYLIFQGGRDGHRGWGIPMATDIAFAVGILALLGRRVPASLKVFLLALAIADDIGAIIVIAFLYSGAINVVALGLAGVGITIVIVLNWLGVRSFVPYCVVGAGVWLAMFRSGIHPTVAGVVLGLITPGRAWFPQESLVTFLLHAVDRLDGHIDRPHIDRPQVVGELTETARETISPLVRLETALHSWVAFGIMPLFALANAGVILQPQAAKHGITWAVALALFVGKPLGVVLFSGIAVSLGIARLPHNTNWKTLLGAGCLAGIGFTMSLFIAGLALDGTRLDSAKIGTLVGSILSGLVGFLLLHVFLPVSPSNSGR